MGINMVECIVLERRREKWEKCSIWAHIYTSPGGVWWRLILLYKYSLLASSAVIVVLVYRTLWNLSIVTRMTEDFLCAQ